MNHTIERKENNGNYEPSNCRWATYREQTYNRSVTRHVEVNGKLYNLDQLKSLVPAEQLQPMSLQVLRGRLFKLGWDHRKALTTPVHPKKSNLKST